MKIKMKMMGEMMMGEMIIGEIIIGEMMIVDWRKLKPHS